MAATTARTGINSAIERERGDALNRIYDDITKNRINTDASLSDQIYGFMERRTDEAPDFNQMAAMAQLLGQGGFGGGFGEQQGYQPTRAEQIQQARWDERAAGGRGRADDRRISGAGTRVTGTGVNNSRYRQAERNPVELAASQLQERAMAQQNAAKWQELQNLRRMHGDKSLNLGQEIGLRGEPVMARTETAWSADYRNSGSGGGQQGRGGSQQGRAGGQVVKGGGAGKAVNGLKDNYIMQTKQGDVVPKAYRPTDWGNYTQSNWGASQDTKPPFANPPEPDYVPSEEEFMWNLTREKLATRATAERELAGASPSTEASPQAQQAPKPESAGPFDAPTAWGTSVPPRRGPMQNVPTPAGYSGDAGRAAGQAGTSDGLFNPMPYQNNSNYADNQFPGTREAHAAYYDTLLKNGNSAANNQKALDDAYTAYVDYARRTMQKPQFSTRGQLWKWLLSTPLPRY
jgi:hypothetical protein